MSKLWSNPDDWVGDEVPDGTTTTAAFDESGNVPIDVDQDFIIKSYLGGFGGEGFTQARYGAGTRTIGTNRRTTGF